MSNIESAIKSLKEAMPSLDVRINEPMSARCSFRAGGCAGAFAEPGDESAFTQLCDSLRSSGVKPYFLGNGTNVVFPDSGRPDMFVVSAASLQELCLLPSGDIYAGAGVPLSRLAAFACEHSLTGLEFASGIPGSVGGGVIMNAGAYGGELKDAVLSVSAYDTRTGLVCDFPADKCEFGYRSSFFQKQGGYAVLSAVFRLQKGAKEEISAKMRDFNQRRRDKQPLDLPSAGSAFRRPEGYFAAALIEECGLKGYRIGGAQVSEKHSGFIVNAGGATASDISALVEYVKRTVFEQKNVELKPEIILL